MGQDISQVRFSTADEAHFRELLATETAHLAEVLESGQVVAAGGVAGFEQEAWLVDERGLPAPRNSEFLEAVSHPDVVSELSRFNFELNGPPRALVGRALSQQEADLRQRWQSCQDTAAALGLKAVMIGILPTVTEADLCLRNISRNHRYHALNERLMRERNGEPVSLCIEGHETLRLFHDDIMLEAATTSFQIHHQLAPAAAARGYNAALILAAPLVAISANAPFLFGRHLWEETRIPLFEGAVDVDGCGTGAQPRCRVTFGSGYLQASFLELFAENLAHYPPLLPLALHTPPERMSHLSLHNGTIWRWIRPIVGSEGARCSLRIEHRVVAAGPTSVDEVANAAFLHGLLRAFLDAEVAPESRLPFEAARHNFYLAARQGLAADLEWWDGPRPARRLILEDLVPLARQGLAALGVAGEDADNYLGIVEARVAGGQTGSAWQQAFVAHYGRDFPALVRAYIERSDANVPVHVWDL